MYYSGSKYSSSSTPPSLRKYSSQSYGTSSSSSYFTSSSRDFRAPHSTSTFYSRSSGRPFTSRFLRNHYPSSSDDDNEDGCSTKKPENVLNSEKKDSKEVIVVDRPTVLNGSVIRIRRRQEVSSSDEEVFEGFRNKKEAKEEDEENEVDQKNENDEGPSLEVDPDLVVEPEPEVDPLDKEENELKEQLMLSLTLTLTDEENIRQRLLEIRKTRLRQREREATEKALVERFQKVSEVALFENSTIASTGEEERNLIQRLSCEDLSDIDRKDTHVRLQEIFRDQRNCYDKSLREVELHYEHILQETSTELTELEMSIRNKAEQVDRLQNEMLIMTVRKELLSQGMQQVNESHGEKVKALNECIGGVEKKMSEYAIVIVAGNPKSADRKAPAIKSEELREIERELECPVCMDISKPPIYQCEEGHIICSNCKPLLTNCPHSCGQRYSEPAIRCRFAEKLAERYFKTVQRLNQENSS